MLPRNGRFVASYEGKNLLYHQEDRSAVSYLPIDSRAQWRDLVALVLLQTEEIGIAAILLEQIIMTARLDDGAAFDDKNRIGMDDGVKTVGNNNGGAALA